MDKKVIFSVRNLSFGYTKEELVFNNIDFNVYANDIVFITGRNGAGKSTLLKSIAGLLEHAGELFFNQEKVTDLKRFKKEIAYIPDSPLLYNVLTGYENLKLIEHLWQVKEHSAYWNNVNKWADELNMSKELNKNVDEYSLGMQSKLFFIANVARDPQIIILDEPFSSWDLDSQKKVIMLLKDYVSVLERALIIVSHSKSLSEELGKRFFSLTNENLLEEVFTS